MAMQQEAVRRTGVEERRVGAHTLFAALLLACSALAHAGAVLDRIKAKGTIVLAHRETSIPFSYLDGDKRPVGYAMDLCLRLVDATRKRLALPALKVEYLQVSGAERIDAIAKGLADLECGSTTNNAERRKLVAFTIPHYIAGARLLVPADSPLAELKHFERKKLVSTKGSTALKVLEQTNRDGLLRIEVVEAPEHAAAIAMVEAGTVDGFVMDDVLLYGLIASRPDPRKLKVVGKFLTIEPLAIMLSKDDAEFKKLLDDEMRRLITGTREAYALFDRWFANPIPPKNVPLNLPMNYLLKDFWKYPSDWVPPN
jgi:ABC-type amino acid transport substrate-binding protein